MTDSAVTPPSQPINPLSLSLEQLARLLSGAGGKKITLEQIQADSERDRWFTADQAKTYGLVDAVKTKRGELPN